MLDWCLASGVGSAERLLGAVGGGEQPSNAPTNPENLCFRTASDIKWEPPHYTIVLTGITGRRNRWIITRIATETNRTSIHRRAPTVPRDTRPCNKLRQVYR